jgi:hypothetical protein
LEISSISSQINDRFYPVSEYGPSGKVTSLDLALYQQKTSSNGQSFHVLKSIPFLDYENENDNPVEDKYRTLAHDLLRGLVDPALKPDRVQRDQLAAIIASSSHHPSREEIGTFQQTLTHCNFVHGCSTFGRQICCGDSVLVWWTIVVPLQNSC